MDTKSQIEQISITSESFSSNTAVDMIRKLLFDLISNNVKFIKIKYKDLLKTYLKKKRYHMVFN